MLKDEIWTAAGEAKKERNAWIQLGFCCAILVCVIYVVALMLKKNAEAEGKEKASAEAIEISHPAKNAPRYRFMGYACTDDCSGHSAGYRWAQKKGIDDDDDCTGNSNSFIEGCLAYVEENK